MKVKGYLARPTAGRKKAQRVLEEDESEEPLVGATEALSLHSKRTERRRMRLEKKAVSSPSATDGHLLHLPYELSTAILAFLRPSDLFMLTRVSTAYRDFIHSEQRVIVRQLIALRYPCLAKCFRLPILLEHVDHAMRLVLNSPDRIDVPMLPRRKSSLLTASSPSATIISTTSPPPSSLPPPPPPPNSTPSFTPPSPSIGSFQHMLPPDPSFICTCMSCVLRWTCLNLAVDFAHWQRGHLDRGEPIPMIPRSQLDRPPAWNRELVVRHAAVVGRALASPLWYARILERHLDSIVRSIRRHAQNKGNQRRRFRMDEADATSGTDAFLERSGPPTADLPYHRDNYYMLEAFMPNRSWIAELKRWVYMPEEQHSRDLEVAARWEAWNRERIAQMRDTVLVSLADPTPQMDGLKPGGVGT